MSAFFEPAGDGVLATDRTRGPWSPDHQHAGPPIALIGRAIERLPSELPMRVARLSVEILKPIPIGPLRVVTERVRPGRRVELVGARLLAGEEELALAQAWRLRTEEADHGATPDLEPPLAPPSDGHEVPFFPVPWDAGYHRSMEWRFIEGAFMEPGPAAAWGRMRVPLVAGEQPTPLQRVLCAADTGNGISATLDALEWVFVNVDITVALAREPAGEWISLRSATVTTGDGTALTDTSLGDERGSIGRGLQSLLVARR